MRQSPLERYTAEKGREAGEFDDKERNKKIVEKNMKEHKNEIAKMENFVKKMEEASDNLDIVNKDFTFTNLSNALLIKFNEDVKILDNFIEMNQAFGKISQGTNILFLATDNFVRVNEILDATEGQGKMIFHLVLDDGLRVLRCPRSDPGEFC